jgi:Asp/Glu/hydantoin racemase
VVKIAMVHSTLAAVPAATAAILHMLPDAEIWHLLDDRLQQDVDAAGGHVDDSHRLRVRRLIENARTGHADAVLLTCSIFGDVAVALNGTSDIPVLAADAAALDAVIAARPASVLILASLPSPLREITADLQRRLLTTRVNTRIVGVVAAGAFDAARSGDGTALTAALQRAVQQLSERPELVLLAQYSLATAREQLETSVGIPVLAGPDSAAQALVQALR